MSRITNVVALPALLVFGAALSPLAAQSAKQHSYKRNIPDSLAQQATVSESDAAKTAEARVRHGRIEAVELENEKGRLVYSYELKARGKSGVEEVNVDAKTGKVVSKEHESAKAERREAAEERKEARHEKMESSRADTGAAHAKMEASHAKHESSRMKKQMMEAKKDTTKPSR